MKHQLSFLLLISFISFTSCDSTPDPVEEPDPIDLLPPITTEQANTFGCLLNGEAWLPGSDLFNYLTMDVRYFPSQNRIGIGAERRYDDNDEWDIIGLDIFFDDNQEPTLIVLRAWSKIHGCWEYELDENIPYSLDILRYDLENQVFAATFEFDLISTCDSLDRIEIREGRMDFTIL